jgi:hypothetical protein
MLAHGTASVSFVATLATTVVPLSVSVSITRAIADLVSVAAVGTLAAMSVVVVLVHIFGILGGSRIEECLNVES